KYGHAPTAVIDIPADGLTWKVGDVITFSGHATDPEEGNLPPSKLTWLLSEWYGSPPRKRASQEWISVAGGSFTTWNASYATSLELVLTATDSDGMTNSQSVFLYPERVNVTLQSSPPGLQLSFNGTKVAAPFSQAVIVGSTNTIAAPSRQAQGDATYAFASWSDGGAASHNVTASAADATFTATFTPAENHAP